MQNALQRWVGRETWHSGSGTDLGKFHSFVKAVWDANQSPIDEEELVKRIEDQVRELGTEMEPPRQEVVAKVYVKRAQCILRYLADTSADDTTIL